MEFKNVVFILIGIVLCYIIFLGFKNIFKVYPGNLYYYIMGIMILAGITFLVIIAIKEKTRN